MNYAAPSLNDMFADAATQGERIDRFEAFKSAMTTAHQKAAQGARAGDRFERYQGIVKSTTPTPAAAVEALRESVTKGVSPEQQADALKALESLQDISKDWTLSNPLSGVPNFGSNLGLVPYDLNPALAMLVPRSFILRNSLPRTSGVGQAHEFRRILGVSNSGTGGVANLSTFFSSSSTTDTFGAATLQRPKKISYAADRKVVTAVEQGVSDEVLMQAQFAGQGYADIRQLSHTALLWAHMIGEEKNLLFARGSGTGYVGALSVASIGTITQAVSSGGSIAAGTYPGYLTFKTGAGETARIALPSATTASANLTITYTVPTPPAGAIGVNIYLNDGTNGWFATSPLTKTIVLTSLAASSATAPTVDTSANALAYDGLVTVLTDPNQSGYVNNLNGVLNQSEPGGDFQTAFASLYASVIGDPDYVLTTGAIRRSLAKSIQQQGNPTGYRLNYETGSDGLTIGSVVSGIQNETTGKFVSVDPHPYMPAGVALIVSKQLPFPDSGVSETVEVRNVTDMLVVEWPQIQMAYDISSYQYGTMIHRAPAWSGAITGIVA